MYSTKEALQLLKNNLERHPLSGCDMSMICQEVGVDENGMIELMLRFIMSLLTTASDTVKKAERLKMENERLDEMLQNMCNNNGRNTQIAKVMGGVPIARKSKKSLIELQLLMKLGNTDKDLLEWYGISKVTLWRWKKELKEKIAVGEKLI